jgi:hypothetical protein
MDSDKCRNCGGKGTVAGDFTCGWCNGDGKKKPKKVEKETEKEETEKEEAEKEDAEKK